MVLTRRAGAILIAAALWTFYIWGFRLWVMWGNDHSLGFKLVHSALAAVSLGFAAYVGWLGLRARRTVGDPVTIRDRSVS